MAGKKYSRINDIIDNNERKKESQKGINTVGNINSYELTIAGKKAAIDEFLGIPLEEQNIPLIGNKDPRSSEIFKAAYNHTIVLIKNGIIPENLREYYENASNNCANANIDTESKKHR